ncbi:MAG: pilus assembly protein [Anaerolineae bacterium]|jgi:Flp pilus assembly protein TadG|nr:pilus assembly protein [Anaerolineae bacterium]
MSRRYRGSRSSESGQDLVEFALLLPLLLLVLFGIIEFGIAVFAYNTTANVGREVARYGSVHPVAGEIQTFIGRPADYTGAPSTYSESVQRWTRGLTGNLTITPTLVAGGPLSSTIQVTVTYEYRFLTGPIIEVLSGRRTLDLRTVTTMYTERPVN